MIQNWHNFIMTILLADLLEYMAAIFRKLVDSDEDAMKLALEFYGPMYLLYSVYDDARGKRIGFFFTGYTYCHLYFQGGV